MSNRSNGEHPDFLQRAWEAPEPHEILRDEELGILIVADVKPVVPKGQVLVIARQSSWEDMSPLDTARFYLAGELVCAQLQEAYKPERGTTLWRFGNDSPTPHLWCFPRNNPEDGVLAFEDRPRATTEQLDATQQRVMAQFEASGFAEELHRRLGGIILG